MEEGFVYRWDHKYNQNDIYVGSTVDDIRREGEHRSSCHNPNDIGYNKAFYKHVRKYGTIDHWKMTVIYQGPEFRLFEKNHIKSTWQYNLNEEIPLRTEQEKKDYQVAYREVNRKIINEKANEKITCDNCGDIVQRANLARHKKTKKCRNFNS